MDLVNFCEKKALLFFNNFAGTGKKDTLFKYLPWNSLDAPMCQTLVQ